MQRKSKTPIPRMPAPLENYNLPDIDQELDEESTEQYQPVDMNEPINPLKETETNAQLNKTESLASLQEQVDTHHNASHDFVNPVGGGQNALFPEEYQVETDTGLVRSTTAMGLDRPSSHTSRKSDGEFHYHKEEDQYEHVNYNGLTKSKLDKAVEKNRKQLEHDKNSPGLWSKLKGVFKH